LLIDSAAVTFLRYSSSASDRCSCHSPPTSCSSLAICTQVCRSLVAGGQTGNQWRRNEFESGGKFLFTV